MLARIPTGTLLLGGIAGPVLFLMGVLIEGVTRPGYDPVRHYVSLLELGDGGWVQSANFIVSGVLIGGFGLGLRRIWRRRRGGQLIGSIIVAVGLAMIWCGVFVPDPAQGYPPGVPGPVVGTINGIPSNPTLHAFLHFLGSAVTFVGLAIAGALNARRGSRWRGPVARAWTICSLLTAAIVIGGWVSGFATSGLDGAPAAAGLLQRISIVAAMQWLIVTAAIELRSAAALTPAPAGA